MLVNGHFLVLYRFHIHQRGGRFRAIYLRRAASSDFQDVFRARTWPGTTTEMPLTFGYYNRDLVELVLPGKLLKNLELVLLLYL